MVRSIIIVALLLVGLLYASLFLMWNAETKVDLVTWGSLGGPLWIGGVPAGFLPLVGALIGAAVMAIAAWLPWAAQRRATRSAEAKLAKVIEKFNEQKKLLGARKQELADLQARVDELEGTSAPASVTEVAEEAGEGSPVVATADLASDEEPEAIQ
ncbi:hypothetical protein LLH03_13305 [bacterium]|nr:hypothetical protein [bacterium]